MPGSFAGWSGLWHRIALACVTGIGLVTIVASGGGEEAQCSFFSNVCNPTVGPFTIAFAYVYPQRITLQVGSSATFNAETSGVDQPRFQWRRSADGGHSYVDIPGATGATYTLAGANLGDDGAVLQVNVQDPGGTVVARAAAFLFVSPTPGIVFQDGEFLPSDWLVSEIAEPPQNGSTHTESREPAGGHPDAYRAMVHDMSAAPSSLSVLQVWTSASYDPTTRGAIYVIDYAEDCLVPDAGTSNLAPDARMLIEQAGRRYVANTPHYCAWTQWAALPTQSSLGVQDFVQIDGPACSSGASCLDFSASAPPLRFGFARTVQRHAGGPVTVSHGIDNWTVTVWRR